MDWTPAHEAHAIERVSISMGFADQLSSKAWPAKVADLTNSLQAEGFASQIVGMPMHGPGQVVAQIVIGPGGVPHSASEGRVFQTHELGNLREEIAFFRDRIIYSSTRYPGWSEFWSRYRALLGRVIDEYCEMISVGYVKLEYWDRFNFDGDPAKFNYKGLFNPSSQFIPSFVQQASDLLHAHVGFFAEAPAGHKRLINVNADGVDLNQQIESGEIVPRRSVGLYSFAQDQLQGDRAHAITPDEINSSFDQLHTILKDVIGDIITQQLADRISLKAAG